MAYGAAYDQLAVNKRPVPAHLQPPPVRSGYEGWLGLFWELSTERHWLEGGMALPIPFRAIKEAARELEVGERELFRLCIRRMDNAFLRAANHTSTAPIAVPPEEDSDGRPVATSARDHFRNSFKR